VGLCCKRPRLCGADVAGNDDNSIVRSVEATIEPDRVVARELLHFVTPADHRLAVGMIEIKRCVDLLGQASARIVSHALVLLFKNNIALRQNDLIGERQAVYPVCFEFHEVFWLVVWYALEVPGVVLRRKGFLLPADTRDHLREFSGWILGGALEHEMFKEM